MVSAVIFDIIRVANPLKVLAKLLLKENCPCSCDSSVSIRFRFRCLTFEYLILCCWFERIGTERFILLRVNKSIGIGA
jgi:hypothetical protein